MRSAKHLKAITSQVEILEDLKIQLESLLEYVKKIIGKGESWIDDTSNKLTFLQINQLLTSETALCYRKCLSIADGNEESPDLEETEGQHNHDDSQSGVAESSIYKDEFSCRDLKLRLEEVEKLVLGHPNSFSALKRKLKDRDKRNKEIIDTKLKEMTQQMNSRFEECMKELCAASDFMYSLDTETKLLSTHLNQNKLEMLDKLQKQEELNDRISAMEKSDNNDTLSLNELNQKIQEISAACCKTESTTKSLVNRLVEIEKLKYLTEAVETLHKDIGTVTSSAETTKLLNEQIMREFSKNSENLHKKVFLLESQINDIICNRHTLLEQDIAVGLLTKVVSDDLHTLKKDNIVTCFNHVISDLAESFDSLSGIFTAPIDGIYMCSLMVDSGSLADDVILFQIIHKDESDVENVVVENYVSANDTMSNSFSFIKMSKNDQLYIKPVDDYNGVTLSEYSQFMCILIKKLTYSPDNAKIM